MSDFRERVKPLFGFFRLDGTQQLSREGASSIGAATAPVFVSALIGTYFALSSFVVSQGEDFGLWLSLSSILARGQPLYAEAFDIKDPIFLWSLGIAYRVLGPVGPYVLSALIVAFAGPLTLLALRARGIPAVPSLLATIFVLGVLTGPFGEAFRSSTLPIVLTIAGLVAAQKKRWGLAGCVVALLFFTKMAYLPLGFGLGWLTIAHGSRATKRALQGFGFTSTTVIVVLALRGEFGAYLEMLRLNFEYRAAYADVVGRPSSPSGRLGLLDAFGANWILLAVLMILVVLISAHQRRSHDIQFAIAAMFTLVGIIAVFLLSLLWRHHLQPLALFALILFLVALPPPCDPKAAKSGLSRASSGIALLIMFLFAPKIGFGFPTVNSDDLSSVMHPQFVVPPEALTVYDMPPYFLGRPTQYARLGPNDDLGLFAFLPSEWVLACRFGGPYGFETTAMEAEMVSCIERRPEILFVSPGFFSLRRPGPYSDRFDDLVARLVYVKNRHYFCEAVPGRSEAEICWRAPLLMSGTAQQNGQNASTPIFPSR